MKPIKTLANTFTDGALIGQAVLKEKRKYTPTDNESSANHRLVFYEVTCRACFTRQFMEKKILSRGASCSCGKTLTTQGESPKLQDTVEPWDLHVPFSAPQVTEELEPWELPKPAPTIPAKAQVTEELEPWELPKEPPKAQQEDIWTQKPTTEELSRAFKHQQEITFAAVRDIPVQEIMDTALKTFRENMPQEPKIEGVTDEDTLYNLCMGYVTALDKHMNDCQTPIKNKYQSMYKDEWPRISSICPEYLELKAKYKGLVVPVISD